MSRYDNERQGSSRYNPNETREYRNESATNQYQQSTRPYASNNYTPHDFADSNDALAASSRTGMTQQYSEESNNEYRRNKAAPGGSLPIQRSKDNPYAVDAGSSKRSKKKWLVIGGLSFLVLAGIAAGIAVWRIKASSSSSATTSNASNTAAGETTVTAGNGTVIVVPKAAGLVKIAGTAGAVLSNPTDPSQFQKDPRLHVSFYGLAYTPFNAQEPTCGATLANVTEDLQIISQLTTRIRMYGSACNQSDLVLQAITSAKLNLTVWLGVYIGDDETVNAQQMSVTIAALKSYGTAHVAGVTVGNEYILNAPTAAAKLVAAKYLVAKMALFRKMLTAAGFSGLPVGTADAGSEITVVLSTGADFIMANVHPFFGGLPIDQAADWTWSYFQEFDIAVTQAAPNQPPTYIAETGWPSMSMTAANATLGGAVSGIPQLQEFLDTYPCQANSNGTMYFFFETFDEPWKESFGGVEPYWGVFTSDKVLKAGITMPTCLSI